MKVTGSIPFHAARAYGIARPYTTPPAATASRPATVGRIAPAPPMRVVDAASDLSSPAGVRRSGSLDRLVAATVHRPISFDGAATASPAMGADGVYAMYTRAADKFDAAVAVRVGRTFDATG